eukprot:scaffold27447_cov62-Phaeocystis_antarctica.AAC.3
MPINTGSRPGPASHLRRACGHADRKWQQVRHLRGLQQHLVGGGGGEGHWLLGPSHSARLVMFDAVEVRQHSGRLPHPCHRPGDRRGSS